MLEKLHQVGLDAERQNRRRVVALEDAQDRFAGRGALFTHHVGQQLSGRRQQDPFAGRAAEPHPHRLLGLGDDAGALRRIAEPLQHLVAAAILRPRRDDQRAEPGLSGEIRIDVGRRVVPARGRGLHHPEQRAGRALLVPLCLHVRDDRHQPRLLADRDRLGDPGARAEIGLRRQPVVIREVRAPRRRGVDDAHDFLDLRVVSRLVVEAGGNAPCAGGERARDVAAHPRDLVGGRPAVRGADDF